MRIFSKENTTILQENIEEKVFICAQGVDACAIIEEAELITPAILEEMKTLVNPEVIKVIASQKNFEMIEPALKMIFENIKYVNREEEYQVFFQTSPPIVRAKKHVVKKNPTPQTFHVEHKKTNKNIQELQKNVKVLVVDDSKTICNLLTKIMTLSPYIEVVAAINDPLDAEAAIEQYNPDVITLDIHMPNMNGVELLKEIYPKFKKPCIMISSISMKEGPLVLEALDNGAVDYIQKPDISNFSTVANQINTQILAAAKTVHDEKMKSITSEKVVMTTDEIDLENNLVVIGASTGGTKALKNVVDMFPEQIPPMLIVQHIPAEFSRAFAERLNSDVAFTVREAVDGDKLEPNTILVAPGGQQMKFRQCDHYMQVILTDDEPVNRFKPSVDYLFDSVANSSCNKNIIAAIFTGMGKDGASAMKRLKQIKNATTIAQDEQSSVVFGMPREAIKQGCVDHIVDVNDAAAVIVNSCLSVNNSKKAN